MLSLLIALVAKYSPVIAQALQTPIASMLTHVMAHKFGVEPHDIDGLANAVKTFAGTPGVMADIENEHGDILKQFIAGKMPSIQRINIHMEFYDDRPK